jgi:hypothetical protein
VSAGDGFLSRWSRRKQDERAGRPLAEPEAPAAPLPPAAAPLPPAAEPPAPAGATEAAGAAGAAEAELPTLADVAALTRESDYSAFVARGVAPEVRNAAMKKLFSDPHFNVMDGLDIYIDDYGKPDPLPVEMLRQLVGVPFRQTPDPDQAQMQMQTQTQTQTTPAAGSPDSLNDTPHDPDPDLQLQSNDAAGCAGPVAGAGPAA